MTLPTEDLDNKTYADLVSEAVARIPVYAPQWTDHNPSDPGITLIEMLAWIAEMQIFRLNRLSERSLLKFLKLLGSSGISPARSATVDLIFTLINAQAPGRLFIPAYTQVAASDPATGKDIVFETLEDLSLSSIKLEAVLTISKSGSKTDNTKANDRGSGYYSAFGGTPQPGDALYFGLDSNPKDQELTLAFYLYQKMLRSETDDPEILGEGSFSDANLVWEYYSGGDWNNEAGWKALARKSKLLDNEWETVRDDTHDLTQSGKARIRVKGNPSPASIDGQNLYWIRIRAECAIYDMPPLIGSIILNAVSAAQKSTFQSSFSSSGLPGHKINLGMSPIIKESVKLKIVDETEGWSMVDDLDASSPGDRHYALDLKSGIIIFGDGIHGKIPSAGGNSISVTFSAGGGIRGNVGAGCIIRVIDSHLCKSVKVCNIVAASGGKEHETLEDAIGRTRKELREVFRAVTASDYEHLALNTPGLDVARAKAMPQYHPSQAGPVSDTVTVIVVPNSSRLMPMPSLSFLKTVYAHLDLRRTMGTEIFVIPPVYVVVSVKAIVIRMPTYRNETVKMAVSDSLKAFLSPLQGGGPDGDGWPFGRSVYISEIYALLDQVKGVDYIKKLILVRSSVFRSAGGGFGCEKTGLGEFITDGVEAQGDIQMPPYALACSGEHEILSYSEVEYNKWVEKNEGAVKFFGTGV